MPTVKKDVRYVNIAYQLQCGFERSTALAQDLSIVLRDDLGFNGAKDDTRGWDGDNSSVVIVTYNSLDDANRLDTQVRELLGRKVNFTYEDEVHTSYARRGPISYVTACTSITV